ncbi:uncharacterized protein HMPREF1541_02655 [Cyphellophora europaea CBS 101466]|uniref:Uncharacterized protein n=1 Tax=Cyphellophora europaea (strain CBS 101466) TaxID=1220924 RepID=W2S469_CYPE1|nr:uncharacterized protein HMPREF1541_02655 [Cyphellophora europaea CBS 101466]ETN43496.1 hypothetical protein HMPREF1541_02655 [Cyphellophora europaea CBS 101466]
MWKRCCYLFLAIQAPLRFIASAGGIEQGIDANHRPVAGLSDAVVLHEPQWQVADHRHEQERERLLHRIRRETGKWDDKHPRWKILEALHGFARYRDLAGAEVDRFEDLYKHVPSKHKKILESAIKYDSNFDEARSLLDVNAIVCNEIVSSALTFYNISRIELDDFIDARAGRMDKGLRTSVSQALKHLVRDWSSEGHVERDVTFPFIFDALDSYLPVPNATHPATQSVLVPGAGLGRLAHEIATRNPHLAVTANEYSAYMNLAYRFASSLSLSEQRTIHPFVESWSHARTRHELFRPISIPDASAPTYSGSVNRPLLVEGDFTRLFPHSPHRGPWDAIVTLFFIDTARNLMQYLETIHGLLEEGGLWINVGPLLYGSAPWVQLSLDEVVAVSERMGFVFEKQAWEEKEVLYNFNGSSLYKNGYVAQFWVARKASAKRDARGNGWWGLW